MNNEQSVSLFRPDGKGARVLNRSGRRRRLHSRNGKKPVFRISSTRLDSSTGSSGPRTNFLRLCDRSRALALNSDPSFAVQNLSSSLWGFRAPVCFPPSRGLPESQAVSSSRDRSSIYQAQTQLMPKICHAPCGSARVGERCSGYWGSFRGSPTPGLISETPLASENGQTPAR